MKLFVSDLDGTLLNGSGKLSPHAAKRLTRMLGDGLRFTVASARSIHSIRSLCSSLPIQLPVVALNGAYLARYELGPHYEVASVSHEHVKQVTAEAEAMGLGVFFSCHAVSGDFILRHGPLNKAMQWFLDDLHTVNDERYHGETDESMLEASEVTCVSVMADREPVEELTARVTAMLGDQLEIQIFENFYSPGCFWMTVHSREARKEIAIAKLASRLGLTMQDVTVFGDYFNDLGMISHAGFGVAMGNAVPEIKQVAKHVIGTNEEDAVVSYLETAFYGGRV